MLHLHGSQEKAKEKSVLLSYLEESNPSSISNLVHTLTMVLIIDEAYLAHILCQGPDVQYALYN